MERVIIYQLTIVYLILKIKMSEGKCVLIAEEKGMASDFSTQKQFSETVNKVSVVCYW